LPEPFNPTGINHIRSEEMLSERPAPEPPVHGTRSRGGYRRLIAYNSEPIFITYSTSPTGSYSSHVSGDTPFSSFGTGIGSDHLSPPSVLSTTPAPVSTNRCFASFPPTGPYRPSFTAPSRI